MAPSHYFSIYLLKANCDVALARISHTLPGAPS